MKKLIISAFGAMACIAASAATASWSAGAAWVAESGDSISSEFVGCKVYFFDCMTVDSATFKSALGTHGADAFTTYASIGNGSIGNDGDFSLVGSAITGYEKSGSANEFVKGFAVILDDTSLTDASYAYIYDYNEIEVTKAVQQSGASFYTSEMYTGAVGSAGWTEIASVPEPTSGLLLLLGMAGLALRRRRA